MARPRRGPRPGAPGRVGRSAQRGPPAIPGSGPEPRDHPELDEVRGRQGWDRARLEIIQNSPSLLGCFRPAGQHCMRPLVGLQGDIRVGFQVLIPVRARFEPAAGVDHFSGAVIFDRRPAHLTGSPAGGGKDQDLFAKEFPQAKAVEQDGRIRIGDGARGFNFCFVNPLRLQGFARCLYFSI